jgi:RNA polymerase II-associated factor 1
MAPENPPPIDPADMPLLMSLEQMRNPAPKNSNVSFLRRTQYISSGPTRSSEPSTKTPALRPGEPKRAKPEQPPKPSRDDPTYIKKHIQKGFDIAHPESKHTGEDSAKKIKGLAPTKAELDAWATPVHPDNPKLKPVGFYPLIPDLQGFPDPGGFVQFKFDKAPVPGVPGKRDDRMDVGILVPAAPEERVCQEHASKTALHKANPKLYPDPGPIPWDYDLFLPEKKGDTKKIKNSLSMVDPNRDNEENYTHEGADGAKHHRYDRVRTYATGTQTLSTEQKYKDVALTLFDPASADGSKNQRLKQKGAYYYPLLGKMRLKPERSRTIAQAGLAPTAPKPKEDQVDQIQVVVRDPDEAEALKRASHRAQVDSKFAATMPSAPSAEDGGDGKGRRGGGGGAATVEDEGDEE